VWIGILVWWSALEPKRRRMRGELWKIPYLLGARMIGMMLGMSFVLIRVPIYTGVYGAGDRKFGLTAIQDQQIAGAMMVTVDILIMVFALCYFFYKASEQADRDEQREREALLTSP
jgi:cytochrome c oxidase assembly factor CtaG